MTTTQTNYQHLQDLAVKEVKGMALDNADLEYLEDHVDVWYDILVELKREVELQLTDKRRELHSMSINYADDPEAFAKYKNKHYDARVKTLRFMASVEKRLRHVKRLRNSG